MAPDQAGKVLREVDSDRTHIAWEFGFCGWYSDDPDFTFLPPQGPGQPNPNAPPTDGES